MDILRDYHVAYFDIFVSGYSTCYSAQYKSFDLPMFDNVTYTLAGNYICSTRLARYDIWAQDVRSHIRNKLRYSVDALIKTEHRLDGSGLLSDH